MMDNKSKGTVFTVKLEPTSGNKNGLAQRAAEILENRLSAAGVAGDAAADKNNADQILVKIYGSEDLEKVRKFLFVTNDLELKEIVSEPYPERLMVYASREAAERASAAGVFEVLSYRERAGAKEVFVNVVKEPIVTGADVREARLIDRSGGEDYQVSYTLYKDAGEKFGDWTERNITHYLAIILDKKIVSAPCIRVQIFDDGEIPGHFTKEEAENIVISLKSGYLPVKMTIVKEETFGK